MAWNVLKAKDKLKITVFSCYNTNYILSIV